MVSLITLKKVKYQLANNLSTLNKKRTLFRINFAELFLNNVKNFSQKLFLGNRYLPLQDSTG